MNAKRLRDTLLGAAGAFALILPHAAAAQPATGPEGFTYFNTLIVWFDFLFSLSFAVVILLTVLWFFWGMITFIRASGDEKAIAEGRHQMLWSVVALFVMVSIWGIVGLLGRVFGVGQGGAISPPGIADEPAELQQQ